MRLIKYFIFLIVLTIIIIPILLTFNLSDEITDRHVNITDGYLIYKSPNDNYTRCLLDVSQALDSLSIPWFLTFGTALMYWRSKNFISNDMDIGIFYEDLQAKNFNEQDFLLNMTNEFDFKFRHRYGQIDHGQEWAFSCPKSLTNIDIFVFYRFNETNTSFTYWTASYNSICSEMTYKKCRWGFSDFQLKTFEMSGKRFYTVSKEFIIERYGPDYMIPKEYDYSQSLKILPNLLPEYKKRTMNRASRKKQIKRYSAVTYKNDIFTT